MKILKILVLLVSLGFMLKAEATVTTVTNRGTILVYSSHFMPGRTNKTVISIYNGGSKFVIAPPHWYYGNAINADIIWWYNYLVANAIPFKWGTCSSFPYALTCLN